MPEKKTASKKKPVSQAPPMVTLPAPTSASKPAAASSPPPATEESIARLIALATSLPDSPLGLVWKHAFEQGSQEGFKRGAAFFKDMDVKQAFREGADQGQIVGILAEREVWEVEGHGQWCFDKPLTCFSCDIGLPKGHSCTANKLDTMVQVDFVEARPLSLDTAIQVSPSHHTSSSQTSPLPLLINAETQAQPMDSTPAATTISTLDPPAFDWSDDASSIPIVPIFPKNQPHCDLSALRTTNPNPFSSLAHHNRCSRLPLEKREVFRSQPPFQPHQAPPFFPVSQTTPRQHLFPVSNLTALPLPSTPLKTPMALDWESDSRLSDLSQALKALGWIRQ